MIRPDPAEPACYPAAMARSHPVLAKMRKLTEPWPDAGEQLTWEHPTFRVGEKIFATFGLSAEGARASVKQTKPDQTVLVQDPRFELAPYVGRHGWVQIHVDDVPWEMVAGLIESSYRLVAGKRQVKALDELLDG